MNYDVASRLAEAEAIIKELQGHEGAEGWSKDLGERLERFWDLYEDPQLYGAVEGVFAKTFVVEGRQLLVYATSGDEADFELHQRMVTSFGYVDAKTEFSVTADAPEDFDEVADILGRYGQDEADAFLAEVKRLEENFKGFDDGQEG